MQLTTQSFADLRVPLYHVWQSMIILTTAAKLSTGCKSTVTSKHTSVCSKGGAGGAPITVLDRAVVGWQCCTNLFPIYTMHDPYIQSFR
jgi:hypothetical protein